MLALFKAMSAREATRTAASFLVAMIVAELFYRFGSFAVECIAFVGSWIAVDALLQAVLPAPRATAGERR